MLLPYATVVPYWNVTVVASPLSLARPLNVAAVAVTAVAALVVALGATAGLMKRPNVPGLAPALKPVTNALVDVSKIWMVFVRHTTQRRVPPGLTATPSGWHPMSTPPPMVEVTVFVAVSMTETLSLPLLVT